MDQDPKLSATLAEIERLLAEARRAGDSVPAWLDQVAVELRETAPGSGARRDLAKRILSDPVFRSSRRPISTPPPCAA